VPLYEVSTLERYVSTSMAQPRFQTLIFTWFAGIAVLLAAIGLYGLLSYMVVQRTLEIGLRMALGAERTTVLGMIVRRGLKLSLIGVAGGLIISAATTRFIAGMLFGVRANDPVTFLAMSGVFLMVTVVASSIPAYRAANLDPIKALKES
jgi:ABC-type antimicrobial peptide transport system permease subunit